MPLRRRAATLVSAAAIGTGLALGAVPVAMAASGAGVTVDSVVNSGQPANISGTCPTGATSAAVRVSQSGTTLLTTSYAVTGGDWAGTLKVTGPMGDITISLGCLADGNSTPVGTATATALLFAMPAGGQANVAVSPGTVALGDTVTVTAACPTGSRSGAVYLFIGDDDPFAGTASALIGTGGSLSARFPVALHRPPGSSASAPTAGPATAVVFCSDSAGMPTGVGHRDFMIIAAKAATTPTSAAAAAPVPPAAPASPVAPPSGSAGAAAAPQGTPMAGGQSPAVAAGSDNLAASSTVRAAGRSGTATDPGSLVVVAAALFLLGAALVAGARPLLRGPRLADG